MQTDISTHEQIGVQSVVSKSFYWMSFGLFLSFIISFIVIQNPILLKLLFSSKYLFYILLFSELGLVWYLSASLTSLHAQTAKMLFLLYAGLNGLTLSVIFLVFSSHSILTIFLSTALVFCLFAVYGYMTKSDLTGFGTYALFGLFGLIISYIVNMFLQNSTFDLVLAWLGVIVFTVLTAYDVQKIKAFATLATNDDERSKASVYGALTLYLDFINLFLNLLRIFGGRRK